MHLKKITKNTSSKIGFLRIFLKNVSIGYILNVKYAFQPVNEEEKQNKIMKLW